MRTGISITVRSEDRRRPEGIVSDRNRAQKHISRAKVILATVDGFGTNEIVRRSGLSKLNVWRWQERFMHEGMDGFFATRPGRQAKHRCPLIPCSACSISPCPSRRVLNAPWWAHLAHWTVRMMADAVGISAASVHRIWKAHSLVPHRFRTFKLSNDVNFASKLRDVVGLYVAPPAHAIVLSAEEKSQIQALDRTRPGLPIKPGRCGTLTHDHKRNGTTTLFAALNVLDGSVIGFTASNYGYGFEDIVSFCWFITCGALVFFISRASVSTALVMGGLAEATRFL